MNNQKQIHSVPVGSVSAHPLQEKIYDPPTDEEFERIKKDVQENGLRQPIEITSERVLIDGHTRLSVAKSLGKTHINAFIIDLDDDQLNERFIKGNLNRRQLGPVEKARVVQELVKNRRNLNGKTGSHGLDQESRETLNQYLGGNYSQRTIDRLLQLARLPIQIRNAVSCNLLPMTKALRFESLSSEEQTKILSRISNNEDPKQVFNEFFGPTQKAKKSRDVVELFQLTLEGLSQKMQLFVESREIIRQRINDDVTKKVANDFHQLVYDMAQKNSSDSIEHRSQLRVALRPSQTP